ncbi:hypothetical protein E2P81_ATG00291 [Venturia nashicola]|uniref:Cupin type-2 domain-containing protein n=1 Tax=Venturia nashicola TaxID=86259 RepID=A0A4Z1PDE6_9PEZI|nr:hypothetical protein E6O75_ATG00302 [Venturia nashicola]TLD39304.1 hypothetical protein E2P81_ATG00291 [Venturia nashicola]
MTTVHQYHLTPTPLIPNSPYPVLHYPGFLSTHLSEPSHIAPKVHTLFKQNGWITQWIFRYGSTQQSHYHSQSHECMAVLCGAARIRFGAADHERAYIEVTASEGDVFLIPAGVAHKTFDASPAGDFTLLTPGEGRGVAIGEGQDVKEVLGKVRLEGFTMMGAYPVGGEWDFATGGEHSGEFERIWKVEKPEVDPVLGESEEGLRGIWEKVDMRGLRGFVESEKIA